MVTRTPGNGNGNGNNPGNNPGEVPEEPLKTVNCSFVVIRNGIATTYQHPDLPYARFVTLQIALVGALVQTIAFGTRRAAQLVEGVANNRRNSPKGDDSLSFALETDHGEGTSDTKTEWVGISSDAADSLEALAMLAYQGAMAGDLDV